MVTRGRKQEEEGSILLFVFYFKMGEYWKIFISLREEASGKERERSKVWRWSRVGKQTSSSLQSSQRTALAGTPGLCKEGSLKPPQQF